MRQIGFDMLKTVGVVFVFVYGIMAVFEHVITSSQLVASWGFLWILFVVQKIITLKMGFKQIVETYNSLNINMIFKKILLSYSFSIGLILYSVISLCPGIMRGLIWHGEYIDYISCFGILVNVKNGIFSEGEGYVCLGGIVGLCSVIVALVFWFVHQKQGLLLMSIFLFTIWFDKISTFSIQNRSFYLGIVALAFLIAQDALRRFSNKWGEDII